MGRPRPPETSPSANDGRPAGALSKSEVSRSWRFVTKSGRLQPGYDGIHPHEVARRWYAPARGLP